MRSPGDRSTRTQPEALDEFQAEPAAQIATTGDLFDITRREPVLPPRTAALSRDESLSRRRERRRRDRLARLVAYAVAWRTRVITLITHTSSSATAASRQTLRRTSLRLRERMQPAPPPATVTTLEYQESNGLVVAVLLGVAVVGYGSFLVGSWRTPGAALTSAAVGIHSSAQPAAAAVVAPATRAATVVARPAIVANNPVAGTPRAVAARRVSFAPNARTLTAMWQRRDTRSLDRAFNSLRHQTLAFHRCGMRVVSADRAVARCNGVATAGAQASRAATWTIDFQRTAGRWVIARVVTS